MVERESGTPVARSTTQRPEESARLPRRPLNINVVLEGTALETIQAATAVHQAKIHLRPARIHVHVWVADSRRQVVDTLNRLGRRRSQTRGVLLAVPDPTGLMDPVDDLVERGVPVVTLLADVPGSHRSAFIGFDDETAGAMAAQLVAARLQAASQALLIVTHQSGIRYELRELGFRKYLRGNQSPPQIIDLPFRDSIEPNVVAAILRREPHIAAAYSTGGEAGAVVDGFAAAQRQYAALVVHDVDEQTHRLLQDRRVSAAVTRDLLEDATSALRCFLRSRKEHLKGPVVRHSKPSIFYG